MFLNTANRDDIWYAAVTDNQRRLIACGFSRSSKAAEKSAIASLPKEMRCYLARSPEDARVIDSLHRIYLGKDQSRLPSIAFVRSTRFLKTIYDATTRIPKGTVTTYGRLAQHAGSKSLARAVGNAMARNPLPLIVPCHRVVRSTLTVGNYGGGGTTKSQGGKIKRALLLREGVQFEGERVSGRCVWDPSGGD